MHDITKVIPFNKYTDENSKWLNFIMEKTEPLENGCLQWTGRNPTTNGKLIYGNILYEGKRYKIHRVLFNYFNPEIDLSKCILRTTCKNTLCVNIDHYRVVNKIEIKPVKDVQSLDNLTVENFPTSKHYRFVLDMCIKNKHVEKFNLLARIVKGTLELKHSELDTISSLKFEKRFNIPEGIFDKL